MKTIELTARIRVDDDVDADDTYRQFKETLLEHFPIPIRTALAIQVLEPIEYTDMR